MKLKKALIIITMAIIFGILAMMPISAYAQVASTPLYLGITELRTLSTPNLGYAAGNPYATGGENTAFKIWSIVKYSTDSSNDTTEDNFYCVKAGVGFSETHKRASYNLFYNMKTERDQIKAQNDVLAEIVEGKKIPVGNGTVDRYNCILAVVDLFYVHGVTTEAEKMEMLEQAGIIADEWDAIITVDEIMSIQQAALWYFTNYGEEDGKYDKTDDSSWLNYTTEGTTYNNLADYNPTNVEPGNSIGLQRQQQAEMYYNYLINKAKANANSYTPGTEEDEEVEVPAEVKTTTLNYDKSEANKTVVGPIYIEEKEGNITPYTIDFEVKVGGAPITNYTLLNSEKEEVEEGTTVKDLVGQQFYVSIPTNVEAEIKVNTVIKYDNTILTLWASSTNNQEQPIFKTMRQEIPVPVELKVTPEKEPEKIFDLALRKYITKIGTANVTNTRVPDISENTLINGNTATYKHRKDPVIVSTGAKVTYAITIYNEGEKAGRATKIVDQLPTGLKFLEVVSGNFELESYNEAGDNKLNLVRKSTNTENLSAYTQGNLDSEIIEILCEVTATPDTKNTKILTNVAWIAEEYDAEANKTITTTVGQDRDSEPHTLPKIDANTAINKDNMVDYTGKGNKENLNDSTYYYQGWQDDDDFEKLILMPQSFDLKLIKRITAVNNQNVAERIESVDVSKLNTIGENGKLITTGDYDLTKTPVPVKKGDIVTYTFRIYNEGTIDGYASEITEDIPAGLEFTWSEKTGAELEADTTLTELEKEAVEFNQKYLWGSFVYDDAKENIVQISTDYLSKENETTVGGNLIPAFGENDGTKTEADISYKEVSVMLKVISNDTTGEIIRNEACISEDTDANNNPVDDRDSDTEDWIKYEDDEDFDNIVLQAFDLSLRKFIIAVSDDETIQNTEYLKNTDGSYTREPEVNTTKLDTVDEDGNLITTAIYNHPKTAVEVKKGDYIVYMLRTYNEGSIDGYAAEIKDHLPSYLEFVDNEFNQTYGWEVSEDGRTVTTTHLANSKINKAQKNTAGKIELDYEEVQIMCKVKENAKTGEKITNIADITKYLDENKESIMDRDSQENNVQLPTDTNLPTYKDEETGSYIPGQQDEDDFEKVIIKKFDLALRKFITKIEDKAIDTRIPEVEFENSKITYKHDKTPLHVVTGNTVIYTIRVYNEGEVDGYVQEITDDIPVGLEFLPENELNQTMRWKMIDEEGNETEEVENAVKITTDYLSKEQNEDNLLHAFNPEEEISDRNPEYRDVQVAFKVTELNSSDRIIINAAQISEDADKDGNPIDDEDSIPDEWNEGEDDQDKEYIKLVEFDLALRKWVTQAIVIENGETTITETGHQPYDDPEQIVKVELHRKKLNQVTVKFKYSIRVINEGEIAGYAKEVTDYIPAGLKFVAEDNQGWTDEGNNVISTKALENTLLQPGEYADVEVILTWVNSQDNMGVMINTAEISEDDNEYNAPDKDSVPDNKKPGEDDIDDAPVMITISTGQMRIYFTLGFIVLFTIAGGVVLIKKFVL